MLEAAEAAEGEPPRSTLNAVPVDVDACAESTTANSFVPEETHSDGRFFRFVG